jgi:hypothetical protein
MTLSARSLPRTPGTLTTALPRYPARLSRWLAAWWPGISGRRGRSAALRAQLGFEPRERLLVACTGPAGGHALAFSDRALYHRGDGAGWSRRGWERVSTVGWEPAGRRLVITSLDGASLDGGSLGGTVSTRAAVPLRERGHLPEIALERITHTRLGSWEVTLPGGHAVVVAARRRPVTDELRWFVFTAASDLSLSLSGSERQAQVERAVSRLATELGLARQPAGQVIGLRR